jgi:hypothetical protein
MAVVDAEGRLFGRFNLLDAAVVVIVLVTAALSAVGYGLLRVPTAPHITEVNPSTLTAGSGLRVDIRGDNILPYLRAYLQRTGESKVPMHDVSGGYDAYTLVNYARAVLLVESPSLAEVRLPEGLLPGTYDLILHNESKIVAVRPSAFTITPTPVVTKLSTDPEAAVRVSGAFTGLTTEAAAAITVGTKLPRGAPAPWGEILAVKPAVPDNARLDFEAGRLMIHIRNRWQVPATLRIVCMVGQFKCWLPNAVVVAPGANLSIDVAGSLVNFAVTDVTTDPPEHVTMATMVVRFLARPEIASMARDQDADTSPGGDRANPARIVSIQRRGDVTAEVNGRLADGDVRVPERVAVLECVVRVPLISVETGWQYRSQAIKAGAPLTFQTDRYIIRGTIASVTLAPPPSASATTR